jgi:hypothetical protein
VGLFLGSKVQRTVQSFLIVYTVATRKYTKMIVLYGLNVPRLMTLTCEITVHTVQDIMYVKTFCREYFTVPA